eukprot:2154070-Pyramimonas_sp.AAC.1
MLVVIISDSVHSILIEIVRGSVGRALQNLPCRVLHCRVGIRRYLVPYPGCRGLAEPVCL